MVAPPLPPAASSSRCATRGGHRPDPVADHRRRRDLARARSRSDELARRIDDDPPPLSSRARRRSRRRATGSAPRCCSTAIRCRRAAERRQAGADRVRRPLRHQLRRAELVEAAVAASRGAGLSRPRCNAPYAGGYIARPPRRARERGMHAIQMEIDRSAYLDAELRSPGPGFAGACRADRGGGRGARATTARLRPRDRGRVAAGSRPIAAPNKKDHLVNREVAKVQGGAPASRRGRITPPQRGGYGDARVSRTPFKIRDASRFDHGCEIRPAATRPISAQASAVTRLRAVACAAPCPAPSAGRKCRASATARTGAR